MQCESADERERANNSKKIKVKKDIHYGASQEIFQKAEELKERATHAEELLWNYLNENKSGANFHRQHPVAMYVLDFYCDEYKLAIEVDGVIHATEEVKRNDAARQNFLEGSGIKTLRFREEDITADVHNIINLSLIHI